jgi:hypothetical protein
LASQAKVTSPPKEHTGKRKRTSNRITGIKLFVDKKPKMLDMFFINFFFTAAPLAAFQLTVRIKASSKVLQLHSCSAILLFTFAGPAALRHILSDSLPFSCYCLTH